MSNTAKKTVISPNFLVWKFCGKEQLLHIFGRITNFCGVNNRKCGTGLITTKE